MNFFRKLFRFNKTATPKDQKKTQSVTNINESLSSVKDAYSFKQLSQGEIFDILHGIGALEEPTNDNEKINNYFNDGDFYCEDKDVIAQVIRNELPGQPYCDILISLTNNWDDYDQIKLGDLQIVVNKSNGNLKRCQEMVQYKCGVCKENLPEFRLYVMLHSCGCKVDRTCFHDAMFRQVNLLSAAQWKCFVCGKPETILENDSQRKKLFIDWQTFVDETQGTEFAFSVNDVNMFQEKIRRYELSKVDGGVSCKNCKHIWVEKNKKKRKCLCPNCKTFYCRDCNEMWTKEHDGNSCEFMIRKSLNDMNIQIIYCPKCSTPIEKVIGHCEHFDCRNCGQGFCPCGVKFYRGSECEIFHNECAAIGYHGHHPRNCYTYLRNMDMEELERLIQMHNKPLEPKHWSLGQLVDKNSSKCSIKQYLIDEYCSRPLYRHGLCL